MTVLDYEDAHTKRKLYSSVERVCAVLCGTGVVQTCAGHLIDAGERAGLRLRRAQTISLSQSDATAFARACGGRADGSEGLALPPPPSARDLSSSSSLGSAASSTPTGLVVEFAGKEASAAFAGAVASSEVLAGLPSGSLCAAQGHGAAAAALVLVFGEEDGPLPGGADDSVGAIGGRAAPVPPGIRPSASGAAQAEFATSKRLAAGSLGMASRGVSRLSSAAAGTGKMSRGCCAAVLLPHLVSDGRAGAALTALLDGTGIAGDGKGALDPADDESKPAGPARLTALCMMDLDAVTAGEHMEVYEGVVPMSRYRAMLEALAVGPCLAVELYGPGAVRRARAVCGPRDVEAARRVESLQGTVRARFGRDEARCGVHVTDLEEDGEGECEYLFGVCCGWGGGGGGGGEVGGDGFAATGASTSTTTLGGRTGTARGKATGRGGGAGFGRLPGESAVLAERPF